MARKKLKSFTVDDAGDVFTPTVKTIKGSDEEVDEKEQVHIEPAGVDLGEKIESEQEKSPVVETEKNEVIYEVKSEETGNLEIQNNKEEKVYTDEESGINTSGGEHCSNQENVGEDSGDILVQLVGFFLGDEEFAVDIQKVQEINRMVEITRVPKTPDFVMGVINLRGKVVPVINLRKRFGFAEKKNDKKTRIIIVDINGKIVGFVVDSVSEVLRMPASTIEPPPPIVAGINAEFIEGVGNLNDALLILLNLDKILTNKEISEMRKVA